MYVFCSWINSLARYLIPWNNHTLLAFYFVIVFGHIIILPMPFRFSYCWGVGLTIPSYWDWTNLKWYVNESHAWIFTRYYRKQHKSNTICIYGLSSKYFFPHRHAKPQVCIWICTSLVSARDILPRSYLMGKKPDFSFNKLRPRHAECCVHIFDREQHNFNIFLFAHDQRKTDFQSTHRVHIRFEQYSG